MATTQPRIMRAYAILAKGDQPKPLGNDNYLVKSQSGNGNCARFLFASASSSTRILVTFRFGNAFNIVIPTLGPKQS